MEILAIKSSSAPPYEIAFQAFSGNLSSLVPAQGPKAIKTGIATRAITLSAGDSADRLRRTILKRKPDLIVALGSKALRFSAPIKDIPIIFLLVPSPEKIISSQANITGVLLAPDSGALFAALKKTMPSVKRVGVLYDPNKSDSHINEAEQAHQDLDFVRRPTRAPQEVADQIASLTGKIDLLWMLPDNTILSPQTEKSFYRFAHQHRIPILAFSEKYLSRGASFAVHLDLEEMGHMAAYLAQQIQDGASLETLPPLKTHKVKLATNDTIINKLGLKLQELKH